MAYLIHNTGSRLMDPQDGPTGRSGRPRTSGQSATTPGGEADKQSGS
jgi:hypothetical protein